MIFIISPAKTMNFEAEIHADDSSEAEFNEEAAYLVNCCKKLDKQDIARLMSISSKLVDLNYERFKAFGSNNNPRKQALFCYDGDVYDGFDRRNYGPSEIEFATKHMRIISGLYGVLRPLDLIEPYRLEMSIKLKNDKASDLYGFWRDKITKKLIAELKALGSNTLYNLASNEYSDVIDRKNFEGQIIDINFKEIRAGEYKTVPINSKRARGLLSDYIIKNKITNTDELKNFSKNGYFFNKEMSSINSIIFTKN